MVWWLVCVGMLAGCVDSTSRRCGVLTCSETAVCSPAGDRCVAQSQLDACNAASDGTGCSYPGVPEGVCSVGVCLGAGCGNGIVDPSSEEQCDDGNRTSLDGCSADCRSDERCGDGIADLAIGELCDCGDGTKDVPGCTMPNAMASGATCRPDCLRARCGDDVIDPFELCDDNNTTPGDGCNATCTGRWTQMASGTFADLYDVWGSGPDDVWAVGTNKLLHYDGTRWTAATLPQPTPGPYVQVWGTGPNDVWALGLYRLDHFDGSSWTTFHTLNSSPTSYQARRLWGTSATDLWVGYEGGGQGGIQHYTGTAWGGPDPFFEVHQIIGSSPTDVYAIVDGQDNADRYRIWRTPGPYSGWAPVTGTTSIDPLDAIPARFLHVHAANDILAYDPFSAAGPTMRHFNGATWTAMPCCDEMAGSADDFDGVSGDYIMVGYQGRIATSPDPYNWNISPSDTTQTLHAVWSYAPNRAFVVGDRGTILY